MRLTLHLAYEPDSKTCSVTLHPVGSAPALMARTDCMELRPEDAVLEALRVLCRQLSREIAVPIVTAVHDAIKEEFSAEAQGH